MTLYARNVIECLEALYGDPVFARYLIHKPERHFTRPGTPTDERRRVYHDMHTGNWWWEIQVNTFRMLTMCVDLPSFQHVLEAQKPEATVMPLIISTDQTQVALSGRKKAYPLYLTIGKLPKAIRCKPSWRGHILIALLPITELKTVADNASRRRRMLSNLFHACLHRYSSHWKNWGLRVSS